ncbi:MAG TPA: hypothetical protein VLV54_16725 [Thermoanaerobaculia bacterium]|nr:hypothetical protein [Thermoanaerobaculia bacterium]
MQVANMVVDDGDNTKDYEVAERIAAVKCDDAFDIKEGKTSEHEFSASEPDEVRSDMHVISKAAINMGVLKKADEEKHFDYTVDQNFVYKKKGAAVATAEVVPSSGFQIRHRLFNVLGDWFHVVIKVPKEVTVQGKKAGAGRGGAYSNFRSLTDDSILEGKHLSAEDLKWKQEEVEAAAKVGKKGKFSGQLQLKAR